MAETEELALDIDKQSIRGRACPRCAGKIIPSDRAVYQSAGASTDVFPLWQCERCGYEQLSAKPIEASKAGKEAHAGKASPTKREAAAAVASAPAAQMRDAKGRAFPRDVQSVIERMNRQPPKN
jgi:ribosomal protein S27AE